ncbi:hypothetical protein HKX68_09210 [Dickeya dadantii]|uniref:hypothetical protein n=1 Tax=Dickeya dadantii TaxID=204038 RepID=UPI00137256F2|nr:hypothetical protein [Dickeya dadantii]NPE63132.1 hypothetical protein [Dickeya dadantii]
MRYHAVVHDDKNDRKFECHVITENPGHAREEVKKYLHNNDMEHLTREIISLISLRDDIVSDLPFINNIKFD